MEGRKKKKKRKKENSEKGKQKGKIGQRAVDRLACCSGGEFPNSLYNYSLPPSNLGE
jgi:hypothetical protein